MSSDTRKALQSQGGSEFYVPPADIIVIAEEDPAHPHHHEHMTRVRPDKPEMLALLSSLREFGWLPSIVIAVYRDGDHYAVSAGRRRLTCVRIENERRKREKDKRGPVRPRVVLDTNPALTAMVENEMREGDPPMVRARRFVEMRETEGTQKAAAALGLSVKDAQDLATILATPDAKLHAAVNGKHIPIDTAARAAKKGSATVRKVIARATSPDGKVDAKVAEAASREGPKRAKTKSSGLIEAVAAVLMDGGEARAATALLWAAGKGEAPTWLEKAIAAAKAGA